MSEAFIPVANPAATLAPHQDAIRGAIDRVLASGRFVLGPEVEAFEHEFAAALGATHGIGVANGTDALELALRAVGVGPGDEVITVANTVTATVAAIVATGARPSFVDIDPATYGMSVEALERRLESGPAKAVVPVHLYGHPVDLAAVCHLAARHGVRVVEDCAQAVGAAWMGRAVGTWGDAAAFSFYPTKNIGCLGDGGAVLTREAETAERVRALRQYGWKERYVAATPGRNSRLDEIQAAVLRVLLPHLPTFTARRREIAQRYRRHLVGSALAVPEPAANALPVYHQFVVQSPRRDQLREQLQEAGIGTAVLYPVPIHLQPGHAQAGVTLPVTEAACREVCCLPIYPGLSDTDVNRIASTLLQAAG